MMTRFRSLGIATSFVRICNGREIRSIHARCGIFQKRYRDVDLKPFCSLHSFAKIEVVDRDLMSWNAIIEAGKSDLDRIEAYLENLSNPQRAAVYTESKIMRVVAGPGSGKTRVLIASVAHLLAKGVSPGNILVLTFTNKAANEMKSRLGELIPDETKLKPLWMGTFHSIATKILHRHVSKLEEDRTESFQIIDEEESRKIILNLLQEQYGIEILPTDSKQVAAAKRKQNAALRKELAVKSKRLAETIQTAKEEWASIYKRSGAQVAKAMAKSPTDLRFGKEFIWCFDAYHQKMKELNCFDFGDLIHCVIWLLSNHPPLRKQYQKQFRNIFVDEMQDTNQPQFELLRLLLKDREGGTVNRLFAVGDPNQSIYGFRGAKMENMMSEMDRSFEGEMSTTYLLENYRSAAHIVRASEGLLKTWIKNGLYNSMDVLRPALSRKVRVFQLYHSRDEANFVKDEVERLKYEEGLKLNQIAVLYRTHSLSQLVEATLIENDIPCYVKGISFWDRAEVKDVYSYLRFAVHPNDLLAFERICNKPARGFGETSVRNLKTWCKLQEQSFPKFLFADLMETDTMETVLENVEIPNLNLPKEAKISASGKKGLHALRQIFVLLRSTARRGTVRDVISALLEYCDFETFLTSDPKLDDKDIETKLENIKRLSESSNSILETQSEKGLDALEAFVQQAMLLMDFDGRRDRNGVQLMTMHSAKGLEFEAVFIIGCENGILPLYEAELQEEARLMFVAMTRAKDNLTITYSTKRILFGKTLDQSPSPLLPREGSFVAVNATF